MPNFFLEFPSRRRRQKHLPVRTETHFLPRIRRRDSSKHLDRLFGIADVKHFQKAIHAPQVEQMAFIVMVHHRSDLRTQRMGVLNDNVRPTKVAFHMVAVNMAISNSSKNNFIIAVRNAFDLDFGSFLIRNFNNPIVGQSLFNSPKWSF